MLRVALAWRISAALLVCLTLVRPASGQGPPPAEREKVRLVYEAPESCTGREQFLPQVRARLGTDWEALPGELARTIHVRVSLVGERYVARIELKDARGRQVARAVAGVRCEQVIEGIALVTVLAIQAQHEELLSQSEPASDDATTPARPPEPATAQAPAKQTPTQPAARGAPRRTPPSQDASRLKLRLGGRAVLQHGAGPGLSTGAGAFAGLAWPDVALGLAVDAIGTGRVEAEVVPAHFSLLAARLDGSGRFPVLGSPVTIEPGLFVQAGSLEAEGDPALPEVTQGGRGTALWLVSGALLSVRAELGPILLGLEASAGVTLDPEQFYLARGEGRDTVYEVPPLVTSAALSAGVTF